MSNPKCLSTSFLTPLFWISLIEVREGLRGEEAEEVDGRVSSVSFNLVRVVVGFCLLIDNRSQSSLKDDDGCIEALLVVGISSSSLKRTGACCFWPLDVSTSLPLARLNSSSIEDRDEFVLDISMWLGWWWWWTATRLSSTLVVVFTEICGR